jgi:hypothetical protein
MLTIFSIPKRFAGHVVVIQRNAIRSWRRADPACEIILFGDETGTRETATEFQTGLVPDVACSEYGTPLLDSVFQRAARMARYPVLCYVNCDIIFLGDLTRAVARIPFRNFLAVGRRWDLGVESEMDLDKPEWEQDLRRLTREKGVLHPATGIDYFVFPRESDLVGMPPFAVGRPGWDNWFIYNARIRRVPVVDLTLATTVIHQNHDYDHVPKREGQAYEGPEAQMNLNLVGGWERVFSLLDATHIMTPTRLAPALGLQYLRRRWQTLPILHPALGRCLNLLRTVKKTFSRSAPRSGRDS